MSTVLWIVAVIAVWFLLGAALGVIIGPVLRRRSVALEEIDADFAKEGTWHSVSRTSS